MKKNILLFLSLILFLSVPAQNFTGQWKGGFVDKTTAFGNFGGDKCDYVLELECNGKTVTGSSYTYFTDGGKKYYTICRLEGFINPKQQYIEIKEIERTKTNVPINIKNCFQVHRLTYFKHGDTATLEGNWIPAPNQDGDCGMGTTFLTRRELKQSFPNLNTAAIKSPGTKKTVTTAKKEITVKPVKKISPMVTKKTIPHNNRTVLKPKAADPGKTITETILPNKSVVPNENSTAIELPVIKSGPDSIQIRKATFSKRSNTVLQTITVKNKSVRVDLYDNGEVDGDSISLFYNGKLLMSSKRLSEKPISLTINVEDDSVNELVMYAENLGTIPPNTALMVVTDGPKRYEVRITSDLEKSGVIDFIHKPDNK